MYVCTVMNLMNNVGSLQAKTQYTVEATSAGKSEVHKNMVHDGT